MVKSMELQAAAERERKAVVTRAEGAKQAMILEAEGRLESAKRDAVAQVTLAESSAQAIKNVASAVGDRDTPMLFLLGEKYIQALDKMSVSQNSKIVVLPADIQETLRGILGKARTA
jgi:regulator of protease activity HflC (stomatin/prohibitin superfamily)